MPTTNDFVRLDGLELSEQPSETGRKKTSCAASTLLGGFWLCVLVALCLTSNSLIGLEERAATRTAEQCATVGGLANATHLWTYRRNGKEYSFPEITPHDSPAVCYVRLDNPTDVILDWDVPAQRDLYRCAVVTFATVWLVVSAIVTWLLWKKRAQSSETLLE